MAQATLTIALPEQIWLQQVSAAHPEARLQLLAAVPGSESGFVLVRLLGAAVPEVIEELDDHPQIIDLSVARRSEAEATVHFETTAPLLLVSSDAFESPIDLPIDVQNGAATVEATGSREQLAGFAERLERMGLQYRIERVQERLHESEVLSERQLEVVVTAVNEGYYDTPRRCSLTELAAHLEIAKSTCSETLHRAEEAIIKRFVEDLPGLGEEQSLEERLATN